MQCCYALGEGQNLKKKEFDYQYRATTKTCSKMSTDSKAADCGVGGPGFKSQGGMIFSTNYQNFVLCRLDSVFHVQV